jgi:hypothetical protein
MQMSFKKYFNNFASMLARLATLKHLVALFTWKVPFDLIQIFIIFKIKIFSIMKYFIV